MTNYFFLRSFTRCSTKEYLLRASLEVINQMILPVGIASV